MRKRLLSLLVAIAMVITLFPVSGLATPEAVQVSTWSELWSAIQAAEAGAVIELTANIEAASVITLTKNITLRGAVTFGIKGIRLQGAELSIENLRIQVVDRSITAVSGSGAGNRLVLRNAQVEGLYPYSAIPYSTITPVTMVLVDELALLDNSTVTGHIGYRFNYWGYSGGNGGDGAQAKHVTFDGTSSIMGGAGLDGSGGADNYFKGSIEGEYDGASGSSGGNGGIGLTILAGGSITGKAQVRGGKGGNGGSGGNGDGENGNGGRGGNGATGLQLNGSLSSPIYGSFLRGSSGSGGRPGNGSGWSGNYGEGGSSGFDIAGSGTVPYIREGNTSLPYTNGITLNVMQALSVSFNSNGGDTPANPASMFALPGTAIGALPTPVKRAGYLFRGWNTAINGGGVIVNEETVVTTNTTAYAQWQAPPFRVAAGETLTVHENSFTAPDDQPVFIVENGGTLILNNVAAYGGNGTAAGDAGTPAIVLEGNGSVELRGSTQVVGGSGKHGADADPQAQDGGAGAPGIQGMEGKLTLTTDATAVIRGGDGGNGGNGSEQGGAGAAGGHGVYVKALETSGTVTAYGGRGGRGGELSGRGGQGGDGFHVISDFHANGPIHGIGGDGGRGGDPAGRGGNGGDGIVVGGTLTTEDATHAAGGNGGDAGQPDGTGGNGGDAIDAGTFLPGGPIHAGGGKGGDGGAHGGRGGDVFDLDNPNDPQHPIGGDFTPGKGGAPDGEDGNLAKQPSPPLFVDEEWEDEFFEDGVPVNGSSMLRFTVKDDFTGLAVQGATLTTSMGSASTNAQGIASLPLQAGEYDYTLTAPGYVTISGNAIVAENSIVDIPISFVPVYQVGFTVIDKAGQPVEDAVIAIGTESTETNGTGKGMLELTPGTYNYTITKLDYSPAHGSVVVDGHKDISITLTEAVLVELRLVSPPAKKTYYVGSTFEAAGLRIKAVYSDGSEVVLEPGALEVTGFSSETVTDQLVLTASFENQSITFTVKIEAPSSGTEQGGIKLNNTDLHVVDPTVEINGRAYIVSSSTAKLRLPGSKTSGVSMTVSEDNVIEINAGNIIKPIHTGDITITAIDADGKSQTTELTVYNSYVNRELLKTMEQGRVLLWSPRIGQSKTTRVTSSNAEVLEVGKDGFVRSIAPGTATLTAWVPVTGADGKTVFQFISRNVEVYCR